MNNLLKRNLLYKNKEKDNYLQELDNKKLTLRKEKLTNNIMKRRFENLDYQFGYFLELSQIKYIEKYKDVEFKSIEDIFNFIENKLNDRDINNIYLGLYFLKNIKIFSKENLTKFINSNLNKIFLQLIENNKENKIIINEIIIFLIEITYNDNFHLTNKIYSKNDYLSMYNSLFKIYVNNEIICNNLLMLLGNIVVYDNSAQTNFYKSNLIDFIIKINIDTDNIKIKEKSFWAITCFILDIQSNEFFKDKEEFFFKIIDDIIFKIYTNEIYLENLLICISAISDINNNNILKKFFDNKFISFILNLDRKYYYYSNIFFLNIFSYNTETNEFFIKTFTNFYLFILNGLNSNLTKIQSDCIMSLTNLIDNSKYNIHYLINHKIINKIIELCLKDLASPFLSLNLIEFLNSLLQESDDDIKFILYKLNIINAYIKFLSNNYNDEITQIILNGVYYFLENDSENKTFKREFMNLNGVEYLEKIMNNLYIKKSSDKACFILDKFFIDK